MCMCVHMCMYACLHVYVCLGTKGWCWSSLIAISIYHPGSPAKRRQVLVQQPTCPQDLFVPWELGLLVDLAFMLLMGTQTPVFTLTVRALSIEPSHLFCLLSLFIYFFNSNYFALYVAISWVSGESRMRSYYWQPLISLKQNFTWFLDYVLDCHIPVREGIWRVLVYPDFFPT